MRKDLEVVLNSTHDAIIAINKEGKITLFNEAAKRLTKKEDRDVLGHNIFDIVPNSRLPLIIKTGKSELNRKLSLDKNTTIITNRMPVKNDDGEIIGAVAVFRDITELDELIEENIKLKEMRILLEAIIQSTQDAISVVDENGIGILVNPAYESLAEMSKNELIGKPCTVDISESEESNHLKVLKTRTPLRNKKMRLGPKRKEVLVDVAPIIVNGDLRGSVAVIHDLSEIKRLTQELDKTKQMLRKKEAKYVFADIIGVDPQIKSAVNKAKNAANTPATVLLRGESGTGKELFAHAIHNESSRKNKPFIKINCAALSENILESELFGYEEGAFTGAKKGGRQGHFERANGGTIFLDEIGEMNISTQAKLLRVLYEKEIIRVGGNDTIDVDVRVIAATNADLERKINEGAFREDLYYRLNVYPIFIPPLRYRKYDIPLILNHIIMKYNHEYGRFVDNISKEALEKIIHMPWYGNVRELENYIGRAIINMDYRENVIEERHLPHIEGQTKIQHNDWMQEELKKISIHTDNKSVTLQDYLNIAEKEYLKNILTKDLKRSEIAKAMGISERNLYYLIKKHNLS